MNYKKIAKFIKDARHLTIWTNGKNQWISDGIAAYPVLGMPMMNEMEMLMFLGLYDKASTISVKSSELPEFIRDLEYDTDNTIIEKIGPALLNHGEVCRTYFTEQGALVLKNKHFETVEKNAGDDPITYFLIDRKPALVAVYIGFDLIAVILPLMIDDKVTAEYRKLVDQLQLAKDNGLVDKNESEE